MSTDVVTVARWNGPRLLLTAVIGVVALGIALSLSGLGDPTHGWQASGTARIATVVQRAGFLMANIEPLPAPPYMLKVSAAFDTPWGMWTGDSAGQQFLVDARGYIAVDAQMRTNQAHIFAIGDIVGNPMLAHKATHEGKVELVSGGPPCQPFSLGGKHAAHNDARDMWPAAVRAVREIRPKAFIFENVKGLTRESFASYLAYIVHQLTYPELVRTDDEAWTDHLSRLERHHTGHAA